MLALMLEDRRVSSADRDVERQLIELMNRYERPIFTFLVTLVRDSDAAMDCTQDTFVRAYEHLSRHKPVSRAWLYKVARNRAMDEFRRLKHLQSQDAVAEYMSVPDTTDQSLAVRHVLEQLSTTDREVLYLFDVAGFKTDEIGAMLGVRGSAIRQRLTRARDRFRTLYGAES